MQYKGFYAGDTAIAKFFYKKNNVCKKAYIAEKEFVALASTPRIELSTTHVNIAKSGGEVLISVTTNALLRFASSESWISAEEADKNTIKVIVLEPSDITRRGILTVTAYNDYASVDVDITIYQGLSLPNVPFLFNYNAKLFDGNKTIERHPDQVYPYDMILPNQITNYTDDYVVIEGNNFYTWGFGSGMGSVARTGNDPLTIVYKVKNTSGQSGNVFSNRNTNYNYMLRENGQTGALFHTQDSSQSVLKYTTPTNILCMRAANGQGWLESITDNLKSEPRSISWGSASNAGAFFAGQRSGGENWSGDFYWIYISNEALSDEEIMQVVDYNENI